MPESVSLDDQITARSADSVDAYKAYLFALHYRDYPEPESELAGEYESLVNKTEQQFVDHIRSRLVFTLSMAIAATRLPSRLSGAELRKDSVPGMQLYLRDIVGTLAMRSAVEEGLVSQNERLTHLINPFHDKTVIQKIKEERVKNSN